MFFNGFFGKKVVCIKDILRCEGYVKVVSYWDDVVFEVVYYYVLLVLVDGERSFVVGGCIDISSGDNLGGVVGDIEI